MVQKSFDTEGLKNLGSEDHLDLLNSVDYLRSQGINHYVSLPQIIVCGDQSSGKSAVLEAISGVSFPIKSNLCTRFPTELILRKTSNVSVKVSIVPHQDRSDAERDSLGSFQEDLDGFEGLPALIESAKAAMGISTHGRAFSKDLLRVEVSGPDRPHLTIVDLPGLIHSQTKHQSVADVKLVKEVVRAYMNEPRSVVLAVISAKNDYANQIVLELARAADPKGKRTIGVITKPDTLIAGSASEATYISLARNQDVEFRLGWHVLKNMDSETGGWSLIERDLNEEQFFSQGAWAALPRPLVGVRKIRTRLSKVLLGQIAAELPSLMGEIRVKADSCRDRLNKLGEPRATLDEQRLYLLHAGQRFQSLIKASVDGTYNDPLFGDAKSELGYQMRIRAVTQNLNEDFAERMTRRGHRCEIIDAVDEAAVTRSATITRDHFIDHIQHLMRRTRGRELPGTFNPMIVADLFVEHSTPWEGIAQSHIDSVWKATREFLSLISASISDIATSKTLFQKIFEPALNKLQKVLRSGVADLLTPHQKGHPITYNHSFIEALQEVRAKRRKARYSQILKSFFGVDSFSPGRSMPVSNLNSLLMNLVQDTDPDMKRFACSEALDCMQAYYKTALKRFVDDVVVEVIEAKLISELDKIFSPVTVSAMPTNLVAQIAGESEENRAEREQLTRELDVLGKGSDTCKRFIGARVLESDTGTTDSDSELVAAHSEYTSSGGSEDDFERILAMQSVRSVSSESKPKKDERIIFRERVEVSEEPAEAPAEAPAEELTETPAEAFVAEDLPPDWDNWGTFSRSKKSKKSRVGKAQYLVED
ncbi:MAG: hypothetical protein M1818_003511 [Claussenomyces sp. TS43310]|nr:MAG: hypothetical protein M1818_003511 [Claussenomyces sp. TS43310]